MNLTLGDRKITLSLSYKTSLKIAREVADPLIIAQEQALVAQALQAGRTYTPRFELGLENVVKILAAAQEDGTNVLSEDEMGELVMDVGLTAAILGVGEYLALLIGGEGATKPMSGKGAKKKPGN